MTRRWASERRHRQWLGVAGYCGLALACLALAALAFLWVTPPLNTVRDRLVEQVHARTGRTLAISGPMSLALFPRVVVTMNDVTVAPPAGMGDGPIAAVPSLDAEVSLWSLLSRRPRVNSVTLHRPTFELVIDSEGRRNWEIAAVEPKRKERASKEPQAAVRPRHPRPWSLRIVAGSVRYSDERSGTRYRIDALDLEASAQDRGGPLAVKGALAWLGAPVRFSATAPSGAFAGGQPGQVTLNLSGAAIEAAYTGTVGLAGGFSADGTLSLNRLVYKDREFGPARLGVAVAGAALKATLLDMEVFGGRSEGSVTVDAAGPKPVVAANLKFTGFAVQPLLKAAAGVAWLDGLGTVALNLNGQLNGQGPWTRQLVETLRGEVQVAVADGALTGFDVDRALRSLQRGRLKGLTPRADDRTPFSALTGTFAIADGIARNDDLKLVGTHVQLAGAGQIELVAARIDYTLNTKLVGGPSDESAALKIGTLEIPLSIKGPLERPEFAIKGQGELNDALRQIGRNLQSRDVQDAIKGLLSGDKDKRVNPGELIEKLLKKEERE